LNQTDIIMEFSISSHTVHQSLTQKTLRPVYVPRIQLSAKLEDGHSSWCCYITFVPRLSIASKQMN